jgi:hypothetical protein
LRIVEICNKKQRSIYVHRDELVWLVGAVEEVIDVDSLEVFWDYSRAGYPRIIAQKCSNRHGRFITIKEFDGRNLSGTVLIPEGRHGQGWSRLKSELRKARSSLWKGRDFREKKVERNVSGRRSYAEAVGLANSTEDERFPVYSEPLARVPAWLKEASAALEDQRPAMACAGRMQTHAQKGPVLFPAKSHSQIETTQALTVSRGCIGGEMEGVRRSPAKVQVQLSGKCTEDSGSPPAKSTLPKPLPNPAISGLEALKSCEESEGDGSSSLCVRVELLDLRKLLTDIRGDVDLGLKRVDRVLCSLEQRKGMDRVDKAGVLGLDRQCMGGEMKAGAVGCFKPKKTNNKKRNIKQKGLLGPKPSELPGIQIGSTQKNPLILSSRDPARKSSLAGESSEVGAARATGVVVPVSVPTISLGRRPVSSGSQDQNSSAPTRELERVGECAVEGGSGEELLALRRSEQLSGSSESAGELGSVDLTPVKLPNSERARVRGSDGPTPVKTPNKLQVFQRKEAPVSKNLKSWVAERVSWNDGRGGDVASDGLSGKHHSGCLDSEVLDFNGGPVLGEQEESGLVGGKEIQGDEVDSMIQFDAAVFSEELPDQGTEPDSPASKVLKLVWDVKGTAGISCDGQVGKLKEVFGQLVDIKYGKGASSSAGEDAVCNEQMRDDGSFYEA